MSSSGASRRAGARAHLPFSRLVSALDRAVAATAAGDATAFVFATARLRAAFAGVGFARARDDANDENQPSKKKPKKSRVALR